MSIFNSLKLTLVHIILSVCVGGKVVVSPGALNTGVFRVGWIMRDQMLHIYHTPPVDPRGPVALFSWMVIRHTALPLINVPTKTTNFLRANLVVL